MNKQNIKIVAATILLITFFLPLSKCTVKKPVFPVPAVPGISDQTFDKNIQPKDTKSETQTTYNIPYKDYRISDPYSWIILICFIWPLPVLAYCIYGSRKRIVDFLKFVEPIACLGSGYVVGCISFMGDIMYGGYLAIVSIISYFMVSCHDVFILIRQYLRSQKANNRLQSMND